MQTQHHRKHGTLLGWAIYGAFLIAVIAWFAFFQFPESATDKSRESAANNSAGSEHRYTGAIVMPRENGSGCRQMKFDNNTGTLQDQGAAPCNSRSVGTNSTEDRMSAIRGAFTKK